MYDCLHKFCDRQNFKKISLCNFIYVFVSFIDKTTAAVQIATDDTSKCKQQIITENDKVPENWS